MGLGELSDTTGQYSPLVFPGTCCDVVIQAYKFVVCFLINLKLTAKKCSTSAITTFVGPTTRWTHSVRLHSTSTTPFFLYLALVN